MAAKIARDANVGEENQEYYVLMVATDGVITDMQQTISSIVNASDLPLSIVNKLLTQNEANFGEFIANLGGIVTEKLAFCGQVIVGVGNADFDKMDVLDADDTPLRCQRTRRVMQRDIVRSHTGHTHSGTTTIRKPCSSLGTVAGTICPLS